MNYEQLREQCAGVCDDAKSKIDPLEMLPREVREVAINSCEKLAKRIRSLPLPEMNFKPVAWFRDLNHEPISDGCKNSRKDDFYKHHTIACYLLPPYAEALRKENDDLRQRIAELESSKALADVAAERRRQIEVEGFAHECDDQYDCSELSAAAECYARLTYGYPAGDPPSCWQWDSWCWKPSEDPRRNLVKAAVLLIAEIERIDRIALKGGAA